jgi:S-adenosylmethionine:tRNA ribosyltransferase-isomerase
MNLSDFDFDLPEALIATRPARPRTSARLLLAEGDAISDRRVSDLVDILRPGDRLVLNNTKVLPARLFGTRQRGEAVAKVEITLLEPRPAGWRALAKPLRKVQLGEVIRFSDRLSATVAAKTETDLTLAFDLTGEDFDAALAEAGVMPLPPYIAAKRAADDQDRTDYQTVFARHAGAVAAPTASLHFDEALLRALAAKGVDFTEVTLHVGAGTFLPVKVEDVTTHKMHAERGRVTAAAADEINATKRAGGRVIPVGTTALRLIESAASSEGMLHPWEGETDIFIYPGYCFRVTDALMTNFHLPKSTLVMLVAALMGEDRIRRLYAHAIRAGYRFFSYGDSSLLIPESP